MNVGEDVMNMMKKLGEEDEDLVEKVSCCCYTV